MTRTIFRPFALGFLAFTALLAIALAPGIAQEPAGEEASAAAPSVLGARMVTTAQRGRLILDLSGTTQYTIHAVIDPDRVVLELDASGVEFDTPAEIAEPGLVGRYTVGMVGDGSARAVMFLTGPAKVQQAYALEAFGDQPARIVVDLIPDTPENFAANAQTAASAASQSDTATPDLPAQPEGALAGRPLIVIDPGHGGIDSGAQATNGLLEKNVVLDFAFKLQEYLVESEQFDVALTRDSDEFLSLEDRVNLARQNQASLMVSLHADSFSQPSVRGASVYTRDEEATDILDKVLAEQENKVDLVAGFSPPDGDNAVVDILVDLMRRDTRRQAYLAGDAVVNALDASVRMRRFPLRKADFFVLQAPDVPSILVELGFLSNSEDTANLSTDQWRDRVASALARGIIAYFEQHG